ncbi:hypothetical protein G6F50_015040 [Rhizopus delemar]|uniref:Uncharacterized protein n=1 Tax=Rhizopus delemar TaxID=936053 RepID=A0A9P6Y0D0_9FUNG|nr:hypothetical protein G6F50_015040 [Rhizopus delemar]
MGQPMLHKGIAVILLGGMGDIRGAMLGGLFLGFAEVLSVAYVGSTMRDAVAFGLLVLILLTERIRKLLGHLRQPGAHAGHQCLVGPLHLADPGLRHAGHGQRRFHGHRGVHRRAAHHELRRPVHGRPGRRHGGARAGSGADRLADLALVRGLSGHGHAGLR